MYLRRYKKKKKTQTVFFNEGRVSCLAETVSVWHLQQPFFGHWQLAQ